MAKLPAFQFYPGDWKKDPGVQSMDFYDRGVWFEMLCLMHESDQRGRLVLNNKPMPIEALARLLGIDPLRANQTVETILLHGVASRDEAGTIYCRRMVRDEEQRAISKTEGKKGGNPKLVANYNQPGYLYVMQRASDHKVKIGISQDPTKRLYKVRYSQKEPVELLATLEVEDMGATEADYHQRYAYCRDGEWFGLQPSDISALIYSLKGKQKGKSTPSSSSSTSIQKTIPPSAREPDPDEIPDGLSGIQYATWVMESAGILIVAHLQRKFGDAIALIGKTESCSAPAATRRMLERVLAAQGSGETRWGFWLEESGWKAQPRASPAAPPPELSPERQAAHEALGAKLRARERWFFYLDWVKWPEQRKKMQPWTGPIPTEPEAVSNTHTPISAEAQP